MAGVVAVAGTAGRDANDSGHSVALECPSYALGHFGAGVKHRIDKHDAGSDTTFAESQEKSDGNCIEKPSEVEFRNNAMIERTKCFVALASGGGTNKYGPDKHIECEIFRNRKPLESVGVWDLRQKIRDIEECSKVVELFRSEVSILQEAEN
ncbi:385_t:CDS:2 [Acaulospora colombiana]|uniref:385_t:CDS:1 n=1 Tax=Acaulospora colombiana TaxID=27376 RepID=A0ACA9P8A7_9GLOM|nr:385_t:CDS:2 [Acaulospora colombiana]